MKYDQFVTFTNIGDDMDNNMDSMNDNLRELKRESIGESRRRLSIVFRFQDFLAAHGANSFLVGAPLTIMGPDLNK